MALAEGGLSAGDRAPNFKLATDEGEDVSRAALKGKPYVLYFYPKDRTPGCTLEGEDFGDYFNQFEKLNTVILGVSRDSIASHERFKQKLALPFELLSDADEKLCNLFDVLKDKNMYGKMVKGIERSTFLIDKKGVLRHEWRKVKVPGHIEEVLAAIKDLS